MISLNELKEICKTPSDRYLRPFAPNTKWRKASVFIVGKAPATPLKDEFDSFDEYWHSLTRYPKRFYEAYKCKRKSEGKKLYSPTGMCQ